MGEQPEALEHHPHLVAADVDQLPGGLLKQVLVVEPHFAVAGLDETGQAAHHRGLAGPGQPHDDEDLADVDVEAHVDRCGNGAVGAHAQRQLAGGIGGYVLLEIGRRFAAIDLPDVAARQLDRGGVRGPGLHAWGRRYRGSSGHEPDRTPAPRRPRTSPGPPLRGPAHQPPAAVAASTQGFQIASLAAVHSATTSSRSRPLLSISSISAFMVVLSMERTSSSL